VLRVSSTQHLVLPPIYRRSAAVSLPVTGDIKRNNHQVRVAIIGVGNCASSLMQGIEFYKHASETETVPGLMHVNLGGYHVRDIRFTAAFDINQTKVGRDLSEAICVAQAPGQKSL